ncbi:hypothetical protein [Streptomyces prasinus]|uniref:hypothetical protein n=1 Tax=Streptomyces prasinus TaxID=67345 RepID=UPI003683808A
MTTTQRIDIEDPEVNVDDAQRLLHREGLFTGEATEHLGGKLAILYVYAHGMQNGPTRERHKDGRPKRSWRLDDHP